MNDGSHERMKTAWRAVRDGSYSRLDADRLDWLLRQQKGRLNRTFCVSITQAKMAAQWGIKERAVRDFLKRTAARFPWFKWYAHGKSCAFHTDFDGTMLGRKRINVARGMAVTMAPGYQQSGLSIVLLDRLVEAARPWGLKSWEFSWVLESNTSSRGTLERLGTKRSKTYRIYDRAL